MGEKLPGEEEVTAKHGDSSMYVYCDVSVGNITVHNCVICWLVCFVCVHLENRSSRGLAFVRSCVPSYYGGADTQRPLSKSVQDECVSTGNVRGAKGPVAPGCLRRCPRGSVRECGSEDALEERNHILGWPEDARICPSERKEHSLA